MRDYESNANKTGESFKESYGGTRAHTLLRTEEKCVWQSSETKGTIVQCDD